MLAPECKMYVFLCEAEHRLGPEDFGDGRFPVQPLDHGSSVSHFPLVDNGLAIWGTGCFW